MPRIPLPFKVLASYVAVLAAGALPAYLYVTLRLEDRVIARDVEALLARARVIGAVVTREPEAVVAARLADIARTSEHRITAIRSDGAVFFESSSEQRERLMSHADRPEVVAALTGTAGSRPAYDPGEPGVGVARRRSTTTGRDTVYVALSVPSPVAGRPFVLRLSGTTAYALGIRTELETYLRNALAVSLSVALLLTLVAALVLVRPLARLRAAMLRVAEGDYGPVELEHPNDEIGDAARALAELTERMRTRIAAAGAGEGAIMQLVEALKEPVAIATPDGQLVAMNGPARRFFDVTERGRDDEVARLFVSKRVKDACVRAEHESEPVPVELKDGKTVDAVVLKRPAAEPLFALVARIAPEHDVAHLSPDGVLVRGLAELLSIATADARAALDAARVTLIAPEGVPDIPVVDHEGRVERAIGRLLIDGAWALPSRPGELELRIDVEPTRVRLAVDGAPVAALQDIAALVEPLGGAASSDDDEVSVWLPRA